MGEVAEMLIEEEMFGDQPLDSFGEFKGSDPLENDNEELEGCSLFEELVSDLLKEAEKLNGE